MVNIRSVNEIILSLRDFFKLAQPDLDTKAGTVARDLFIDGPASQVALLYDEVSSVSSQQSLRLVLGSDLDKLAKNYGVTRKQATPSNGVALFTFSSITVNVNINKGDIVLASNGFSFSVANSVSVSPASSNFYRSVASKFSDQLSLAGISDQYAVEVTVIANTPGSAGNIGTYSLNSTKVTGVSNVTNVQSFTGGTDQENDTVFRNRILSSFSGSSVGTALGYLNVALGTSGVSDAIVIEPGDPLMTRDGTVVKINSDGSNTIVSEGSGGKVDIVVLGSILVQNTDSYIYQDKSNNNDPTNYKNNVVLGQIAADINKTINRKRIDDIANGQLPNQPVDSLLQVAGSLSGIFAEKTVDSLGRIFGNYELIKDTGVYGGSPWGSDTFHWINKQISFSEDLIKGQLNGQDATTFKDVLNIPNIQQNISIINENSIVTSDRSVIQLLHTPATNVTRVLNVNTGERYIITNQNLDATPTFNTTGRIQISGNTLPSPSDILQVDYSWIVSYDQYSDYDGLINTKNARIVNDSIDWGYSSLIKNESILFTLNTGNNFFVGNTIQPVGTVITASKFLEVDGVVSTITSGVFTNRLSVIISNLFTTPLSVNFITFKNTNIELYNTAQNDGNFTSEATVVGLNVLYVTTIILPTDTVANSGDTVTVILDSTDVFNSLTGGGSSNGTQITIPSALINTTASTIILRVTYIANINDFFSSATTSLPTSRSGNGFILTNNNGFNNFSPVNISRRENQIVQQNNSNQLYIELSASSSEYSLLPSQIFSVIRLSDSKELWNTNNIGNIVIGLSGNYQLIFSGFNTPALGDRVLIIYYVTDTKRFQPFSYSNLLIKSRIDNLSVDPGSGKFTIPINNITSQASNLTFSIIEPNTNIVLFSVSDGYLTSNTLGSAFLGSLSVIFSTLPDLTNKKVKITGAINSNNNGIYDILSYSSSSNTILIKNVMDKITADQISIIRILDSKEIWNYSGVIDIINNKLLLPIDIIANTNDNVFVLFFKYNNLRKSPTGIIGTISDQINNTGVITVNGTSLTKAQDIIFTATNTGLKLNLSEAIRKALNLNSASALPNNVKLVRITKLEKVITASANDDNVLEILTTYDLKNTTIQNNLMYADELLSNPSLQNLDFILPNTKNNTSIIGAINLPKAGDKLRITFYYSTDNDLENLSYTRNGALYTNKKFSFINKIFVSSGFKISQSTKFTGTSFTQPILGARYKVFYDYLAPKQNERISITYNSNRLISDVIFNVEASRPINADVLARAAKLLLLNLTINVVISTNYISSTPTVLQNLRDALNSALTANTLNSVIDQVTLINIAQGVQGIARARILFFNKTGQVGQVLIIQAQKDEYFRPNNIIIHTETR